MSETVANVRINTTDDDAPASNRTGLTLRQLREAMLRNAEANGYTESYSNIMDIAYFGRGNRLEGMAELIVPPDQRVVPAASVPTPEVIAALRVVAVALRAWSNPKLNNQAAQAAVTSAADQLPVIDAYLKGLPE